MKFLGKLVNLFRSLFIRDGRFDSIRTRRFILEDGKGAIKAEFVIDKDKNVVLRFIDDLGQTRLYIGLTSDGTPRIGLTYGNGKGSIQLEANDRLNSSAIVFCGTEGRPQILLGIANTGNPAIGLYDSDGKLLFPNLKNVTDIDGKDINSLFTQN